jgi:hypothetical protein
MTLGLIARAGAAGILTILLAGAATATLPPVAAQAPVDLNAADAMRMAIEQHAGQRVRLKLVSGQDVEGRVAKVGTHAVAMTELSGMELFDATVRLEQVAAVIVRRAAK